MSTKRRRTPWWALALLAMVPLWALMYARALTPTTEAADTPLGAGVSLYTSNCATCHGSTGQGVPASGYPFNDGSAVLTFPRIEDQLRFVYHGTDAYRVAGIEVYGDPDRPGGARRTGERGSMPGFGTDAGGTLTETQLVAIVCHERYTLGGVAHTGDVTGDEFDVWCAPEALGSIELSDISDSVRAPEPDG